MRCKYAYQHFITTDINNILFLSDRKMIAILRLLHLCVTISISWGQSLLPILCFRVIHINLTYGTSSSMPSAIALYAALLSRFGSLSEADKWATAANALQDKLSSNVDYANVTFYTYGGKSKGYPWSYPIYLLFSSHTLTHLFGVFGSNIHYVKRATRLPSFFAQRFCFRNEIR